MVDYALVSFNIYIYIYIYYIEFIVLLFYLVVHPDALRRSMSAEVDIPCRPVPSYTDDIKRLHGLYHQTLIIHHRDYAAGVQKNIIPRSNYQHGHQGS